MKILLAGATGFIGRKLGLALVKSGHEVWVTVRNPSAAVKQLPFPCHILPWPNPGDGASASPEAAQFAKALENVTLDAVVNLVGEPILGARWTPEFKKRLRDSRVETTQQLITALAQQKSVQVFVQGSAIGWYGDTGAQAVDEHAPIGQGFLAELVREWEHAAATVKSERIVQLRTGVVLGHGGGALEKIWPLFVSGVGGVLGDGQQGMSWIHQDDLVGLILFALENKNASGPINGVAPLAVSNKEFSVSLARHLGVSLGPAAPKLALKLALGESSCTVLDSQFVKTKAEELGYKFKYRTLDQALDELCAGAEGGRSVLYQEQWIKSDLKSAFDFFSDESNLEVITPDFLGFKVLGKDTPQIQSGTLIDYKLSLHGIPLSWQTLITDWQPPLKFVDTQKHGPYTYWHHTHTFEAVAGGVLLIDQVVYKSPMGALGNLVAGAMVRRDLAQIFAFRREKIAEMFAAK